VISNARTVRIAQVNLFQLIILIMNIASIVKRRDVIQMRRSVRNVRPALLGLIVMNVIWRNAYCQIVFARNVPNARIQSVWNVLRLNARTVPNASSVLIARKNAMLIVRTVRLRTVQIAKCALNARTARNNVVEMDLLLLLRITF